MPCRVHALRTRPDHFLSLQQIKGLGLTPCYYTEKKKKGNLLGEIIKIKMYRPLVVTKAL